jgi:hypothetical protein
MHPASSLLHLSDFLHEYVKNPIAGVPLEICYGYFDQK